MNYPCSNLNTLSVLTQNFEKFHISRLFISQFIFLSIYLIKTLRIKMERALFPYESHWATPNHYENLVLAIKYTSPKYVQKAVNNFKKMFRGFNLKIVNNRYYRLHPHNIETIKLPEYLQDCHEANQWMYRHHSVPIEQCLATIAANDTIVTINSNHNLSDGGYMRYALQHALDDFSDVELPSGAPPCYNNEFKEVFEYVDKKIDRSKLQFADSETGVKYNPKDKYLAPFGTPFADNYEIIPVTQLACYDCKTKRPKNLTESSWIGLTIALASLNCINNKMPFDFTTKLSLGAVLDCRRFIKSKENLILKYPNFNRILPVEANTTKDMTLREISQTFRGYLNDNLLPYGLIYSLKHPKPFQSTPKDTIWGINSSVGVIKFKRPVLDFDLLEKGRFDSTFGDRGEISGSPVSIITYSKVNEDRNDFILMSRYRPFMTSMENGRIIVDSFRFFMKNIPETARFEDAFNEIRQFQLGEKRNYV